MGAYASARRVAERQPLFQRKVGRLGAVDAVVEAKVVGARHGHYELARPLAQGAALHAIGSKDSGRHQSALVAQELLAGLVAAREALRRNLRSSNAVPCQYGSEHASHPPVALHPPPT